MENYMFVGNMIWQHTYIVEGICVMQQRGRNMPANVCNTPMCFRGDLQSPRESGLAKNKYNATDLWQSSQTLTPRETCYGYDTPQKQYMMPMRPRQA
jgi:hypothetical protein